MNSLLEAALDYAGRGWRVVPLYNLLPDGKCACGRSECSKSGGKHPRVTEWQKKASSDPEQIRRWWATWPDANVGVMCGQDTGFMVVDVDGPEGEASLMGRPWPRTHQVKTGRGHHYHFKWPELDFKLKNNAGILPGIDIKVGKGQVVMPPSVHFSGSTYEWIVGPDECELAEAPAWLVEILKDKYGSKEKLKKNIEKLQNNKTKAIENKYARKALEEEVAAVAGASEGSRNDQLNISAFKLATLVSGGSLEEIDVRRQLERAAARAGLSEGEIKATLDSALGAGKSHPRAVPDPQPISVVRSRPAAEPVTPTRPEKDKGAKIREMALYILQHGNPIEAIVESCSRIVLGAEVALRKLICCVAVQDVAQSEGLHPKMSGESGAGKTAAVMIFAHHLPLEAVLVGSMSNKAAFYHAHGDRLFRILDDYQAGNEDLDTIIKQTTSLFHAKYQHRTVINQRAAVLEIGSEQTWAITSVDSSQDIQVLNRQIPINVDDSEELTAKVNRRTIERYGKGELKFPEDIQVEVCREIWRILREEGIINVRVPFWERIEWLDTSNRRNPSIFMDLLVAHTAMFRHQREIDAEGYYLSNEGDFHFAAGLFSDKAAEELVKRLTRKEREFAELLARTPGGLTKKEVAKLLKVSPNRVCQLAYGEAGKGGLVQKLVGFNAEEIVDTENINGDERRSTKKTLFTLGGYNPLTGYDVVVKLNSSGPRKECKGGVSD